MVSIPRIILLKIKLSRWRHFIAIGLRLLQLRLIRNETNSLLAKQAIAGHLGHLGGISMKIGQLVADVGNGKELRALLDGNQARPLAEMLPSLAKAVHQPDHPSPKPTYLLNPKNNHPSLQSHCWY
jgi:hypothetical protein